MADRGYRRMTVYVREAQVPVVEALKIALREMQPDDLAMYQRGLHDYFVDCARDMEQDLKEEPKLARETTIEVEIAVFRAAADATAHTERSEGGRSASRLSDDQ